MSSLFTDVYSKITIFDGNFPKCSSPGPDIELRIPRQVQARDVARHQHATVLALTTLEWSDWKSLKNIIYKYIVGTSLQLARLRVCNVVCTFYIYICDTCAVLSLEFPCQLRLGLRKDFPQGCCIPEMESCRGSRFSSGYGQMLAIVWHYYNNS